MPAPDTLSGVQFAYMKTAQHHVVQAKHGDDIIGELHWHHTKITPEPLSQRPLPGVIADVGVDAEHRRKGVATGMWNYANSLDVEPKPMHSPSRTPASKGGGDPWAKAVGGKRPMTHDQARLMSTGL